MTKTTTFRGVIAALLLAFTLQSSFAQVFWTETFSDQATSTANWANGGTNGGTETWTWENDPTLATFGTPAFAAPTAASGFFLFNSDANGEFDHDVTLTGPSINCSSSTNTKVTFWAQYARYTDIAVAELQVSADGGATWTVHTLFVGHPADNMYNDAVSVSIPEANGKSDVKLRFRWVGNYEYSWKVDDIQVENVTGPVPCDQNPMAIICDNLDTYNTALKLGPQSDWWTTWSGTEGTAEDGIVSTEQASTAPNSLKVISTTNGQGPQDVVLDLDNRSTGRYELKFKVFVPTGKWGYYNMQNVIPIAGGGTTGAWNFNVHFEAGVAGRFTGSDDVLIANFTYPHDQWFECKHVIDLDNNLHTFWVNGTYVRKVGYTGNIGGIDFFGVNNISTFYVDDVEYIQLPPVVSNVDECAGAVDLTLYLGQTANVPQLTGLYDNTTATVAGTDPAAPSCWFDGITATLPAVPKIDGSMWYTFTGDGSNYHIETVPCTSGANYIDNGDTQMAIYTGDCGALGAPVLCNDDLTGAADFRAGLDIQTVAGTDYRMLIDGWSDENGVISQGQFCIQITRVVPTVTCAQGAVGTYTLSSAYLCNLAQLSELITVDPAGFVIPNEGPVFGLAWAITTVPVPANTWPATLPNSALQGSTGFLTSPFAVGYVNDGTPFAYGAWWITPIVVGAATDTDPADGATLFDVDPAGGCFFVGQSSLVNFLDELAPLDATAVVTPPTPGNNDGAIDLTVTGGFYDVIQDPSAYTVEWSGPNGYTANTEDISGLAPGDYTAIITDVSGCADPYDYTVGVTSSATDPASVKSLTISPNPTSSTTLLNMVLENAAEVRIEVLNTVGQTLHTVNAGNVSALNQRIDLGNFANGTYLVRVTVDGETAMRRVVLQR